MADKGKDNQNAVKHGIFSRVTILPGEDFRQFESLHQQVRDEWEVEGIMEEDAALDIAHALWLKQRLASHYSAKIQRAMAKPSETVLVTRLLAEEPLPFAESLRERAAKRDPDYRLKLLHDKQLQSLRGDAVFELLSFSGALYGENPEFIVKFCMRMLPTPYKNHLNEKVQLGHFETIHDWIFALKQEVDTVLLPQAREALRETVTSSDSEMVVSFREPDVILQELDFNDRINAKLEKAIKRMVNAKALKQINVRNPVTSAPKQIEAEVQE